jgi:acyl-CoA synthetase (AMP-forming)/AMP-acid ligase II
VLLPETLGRMAAAFGDRTAYTVVDQGSLTFAEWDRTANQLARGLVAAGLRSDDRVALHLSAQNALRWLVAYAAVHRAGGVAVPLNPRLAPDEVRRMLAHSSARCVVADGALVAADARLAEPEGDRPAVPLALVVDATAHGTPSSDAPAAATLVRAWEEVLSADASPIQVPRVDDDLADILYTSGTTGSPKGVAVRHVNASMVPPAEPSYSGGGWLHASPMFTFAGMSFVYNPMILGLRGIYLPVFDAGRWLEVVEAERPVAVFLVPAMAQLLLDHPRFAEADLTSIAICSVGSAPLAPFVLERLQERMPEAMVSNNYGMTEAGSVYCLMPKGEAVRRPGSVGQPVPPAQVRCVDEHGVDVAPGDVGEVWLRIPGRPREYFGDPEATATTWRDGWLITGDLGRLDEDGYLYIVGRSKDVIIRGGVNIHSADVEHVILSHPAVAEVAVVGKPHPVLGEDVVAFVVLRPGEEADAEGLRAFCLERMADYKVPRSWILVDEIPRNATGKALKSELRRRLEQDAAAPSV